MGTGRVQTPRAVCSAKNSTTYLQKGVFCRFLVVSGHFEAVLAEKKCAGVPEAFRGLLEVVASGHGV